VIYVVIALNVLAWIWALAMKFNDLRHIKDDINQIKDDIKDLRKITAEQGERLSNIEGRFEEARKYFEGG